MYYTVEVDGETKTWLTMEFAFTDVFSRGFIAENGWTLRSHPGEIGVV